MSITYEESQKIFKLDTLRTTYMIAVTKEGYVGHLYYGKRLMHPTSPSLLRTDYAPFTPTTNNRDKSAFLDSFPMEYPSGGTGDFRESAINLRNEDGQMGCEFYFDSYKITTGKIALPGLPASFGEKDEVETLEITVKDPVLNVSVVLSYSVFEEADVITRSEKICNTGKSSLRLEKAYSACLDMDHVSFEMITLCGGWARERHLDRYPIHHGKQMVSSTRGESSHQEHPFLALVSPETTHDYGDVYAMHFVYSGNFIAQAEVTQFDSVRMVMGISAEEFNFGLGEGETFQTPEVVLTYSSEGLGRMTRTLHDFYRKHLIRSSYLHEMRPILINNWEATYFDFTTEKLIDIAKEAKTCGIEMFVMDDGWFGKRNADNCSLGDWTVNEEKIHGGLKYLVEEVKKLGLKFGIWFEPEMVSPDSDLFREHPDWAIQIAGRTPCQIREQYVLDLSRKEVRDHAYESVARILRSAPIDYVKWDMNRQLCDIGSSFLSKGQQGELLHRYVLGVYELQERLVQEFPNLLLENCSGGGARFDPGMLYYSPQIWCSDDTDAIERLRIQEGTALIYPLSVMGAHVSDCPNHACGRTTPFTTRGNVALAGTFGYELDVTKISQEERDLIPLQVALYHKYHMLIAEGDYYRIHSWNSDEAYDCYDVVSKDGKEALLSYVQVLCRPNVHARKILLKGLAPELLYRLEETGAEYYGEELMQCGFLIPEMPGDFQSKLFHFTADSCALR